MDRFWRCVTGERRRDDGHCQAGRHVPILQIPSDKTLILGAHQMFSHVKAGKKPRRPVWCRSEVSLLCLAASGMFLLDQHLALGGCYFGDVLSRFFVIVILYTACTCAYNVRSV